MQCPSKSCQKLACNMLPQNKPAYVLFYSFTGLSTWQSNCQTQLHRMDKSDGGWLLNATCVQRSDFLLPVKPRHHVQQTLLTFGAQGVCIQGPRLWLKPCVQLSTVSVDCQLSQSTVNCLNPTIVLIELVWTCQLSLAKEPMVWWKKHLFFQEPWCKQGNHCRSMLPSWTLLNLSANSLSNQLAQCETRTEQLTFETIAEPKNSFQPKRQVSRKTAHSTWNLNLSSCAHLITYRAHSTISDCSKRDSWACNSQNPECKSQNNKARIQLNKQ